MAQHNVTLRKTGEDENQALSGKNFPCPVCGTGIPVLLSYKGKPYCTCNDCGLQVFIRGKSGIARLTQLLAKNKILSSASGAASTSLALFNQLESLRKQKQDLEEKQGVFFKDQAIADALSVVNKEIIRTEKQLQKMAEREETKK
jgi:DNA-directed RNA polymerase subunit RPC12/RpoP